MRAIAIAWVLLVATPAFAFTADFTGPGVRPSGFEHRGNSLSTGDTRAKPVTQRPASAKSKKRAIASRDNHNAATTDRLRRSIVSRLHATLQNRAKPHAQAQTSARLAAKGAKPFSSAAVRDSVLSRPRAAPKLNPPAAFHGISGPFAHSPSVDGAQTNRLAHAAVIDGTQFRRSH